MCAYDLRIINNRTYERVQFISPLRIMPLHVYDIYIQIYISIYHIIIFNHLQNT
jgi:hypothetical protein